MALAVVLSLVLSIAFVLMANLLLAYTGWITTTLIFTVLTAISLVVAYYAGVVTGRRAELSLFTMMVLSSVVITLSMITIICFTVLSGTIWLPIYALSYVSFILPFLLGCGSGTEDWHVARQGDHPSAIELLEKQTAEFLARPEPYEESTRVSTESATESDAGPNLQTAPNPA